MADHISAKALNDLHVFVSQWYKSLPPVNDLDGAEELAQEIRQRVGEITFEAGLLSITGRASYRGPSLPCSCGSTRRFVSYRRRWVKSLCGEVQIKRAYYHCAQCGRDAKLKQEQSPWDSEQGLTGLIGTPRFKASVCRVMGAVPYSTGVDLISDLCNVSIEESTAETIVLEVGKRIRAKEQERVDQVKLRLEHATKERLMEDTASEPPVPPLKTRPVAGNRIYFGVDAMTAHVGGDWHNVQNGVVFTVKQDKDGMDTLFEREYTTGQMDMQTLGWRMRSLCEVWQGSSYLERLFLGDGAHSNWNIASTYFPGAIMILDFWHASEHISELSKKLYRQNDTKQEALRKRWVADRLHSLKHHGPKALLRSLKRRICKTPEQSEAVRKEIQYFKTNQQRMNYPAHIAAGRMIGSGPIEAACKSTGGRVKGTGMRWTPEGIDAVLAVRMTILNGNADQLATLARAA